MVVINLSLSFTCFIGDLLGHMFLKYRAFFTNTPLNRKDYWSKGTMLYILHTVTVLPFLFFLMFP